MTKMTETEKLMDRLLADTMHTKRGGSFDPFNGRRIARPIKTNTDENGLQRLDYPSKRKGA